MWNKLLIVLLSCGLLYVARVEAFDHSAWDQLLRAHVAPVREGKSTAVDYAGMAGQRAELKSYLQQLTTVSREEFDEWQASEQLAFLINAYNAWTVELVLTEYPGIESIKDLGSLFRSPWKKPFIPLLGETRSLGDIEHGLIRGSGRYFEPRIHFAVNCASIGCPPLRGEAYTGKRLDAQLEAQTQCFLADRSRNRLNGDVLEVSSIFKWYRKDFAKGWRGSNSLMRFFAHYRESLGMSDTEVERLLAGKIEIDFLDYDWRLNGKRNANGI